MPNHVTFQIQGLEQDLKVARFDGHEGISELYELDVLLAGNVDHPVDIDAVAGKEACFTLPGVHGPRYVYGVLTRFQQADVGAQGIAYVATVAPRVHLLQHRHDVRIFQPEEGGTLTVAQIIPQVLEGAGLSEGTDFRLALRGDFTPRDYCAQYRESDWAFVCRLMEEEGIFYFFEHHEDKHVLVIADSASAHEDIGGGAVRFHASTGALVGSEHVDQIHVTASLRPEKYTLRDYNFEKPRELLQSVATAGAGAPEIYDYPGAYTLPANGDRRAQLRLEEQQVRKKRGEGDSRCPRLVPGSLFELQEHPLEGVNRKYLVTRVHHSGYEPGLAAHDPDEPTYRNRFAVIPHDVPFRAPRITPRPVIAGVQTAVVVCPSGEEIETDKYGRIKVRFPWDREGKTSFWVRVGQPWAGAGFGAMFIPRQGQEVIVDFLEGDPDRPLIVGSLYHGTNVTPYVLPSDKTKSTIKSNSSPGGGGFNELRFEDKKNSEEVYLHAQKDLTIQVLHDEQATIGHDQAVTVQNDRHLKVTANETIEIGKDRTDKVSGDETLTVDGQRTRTVNKGESETIKADKKIKIGQDLVEDVDGNASRSVAKDATTHVIGKDKLRVDDDATLQFKKNRSTTVESSDSEEIKVEKTLKIGQKLTLTCGSAKVTVSQDGKIEIDGGDVSITATGGVTVKGGKLDVESSGAVTVKGGSVVVNGGTVALN